MLKRGAMEHRPTPTPLRKREPLPGSDGLTPNGAAEISHATDDPDAPSDPVILPTSRPPWKADNDCIHNEDMPERFTEHLRCSNIIERFNEELRRRLDPARIAVADKSLDKIIYAVATEQQK